MNLPENDYQILKLTNEFYCAYPNPPYKEILKKKRRAYNCLLFQIHKKEALDFVEDYVAHMKEIKLLHKREFDRRYSFSPLKYFHKELGISEQLII